MPPQKVPIGSGRSSALEVPDPIPVMGEFGVGVVEVSDHGNWLRTLACIIDTEKRRGNACAELEQWRRAIKLTPMIKCKPRDAIVLENLGSSKLRRSEDNQRNHGQNSDVGNNNDISLRLRE